MRTPHRRATALASLALVLAPVLSSCGFDYATNRDYNVGVGTDNKEGDVNVLAAVIVSAEDGEGVFVAGLASELTDDSVTLEDITGTGTEDSATFEVPEGIEVEPGGFLNLNNSEEPIRVTGDFAPGQFVPAVLSFSNGERVEMDVFVVSNCDDYANVTGLPVGEESCSTESDTAH